MTTLTKALITIGITLFLVWHPVTRKIIFIILPLGRGGDDLIFWVLLVLLFIVAFVKGWINIPKIKNLFIKIEREEND